MAGKHSDKGGTAKQAAQSAAKVVLAKHPAVVAGSVQPTTVRQDVASAAVLDVGTRNIGRGLKR